MIGLPNQTLESLALTIVQILKYDFGHLSLYMLQLEHNTPFYKKFGDRPELLPSDELVS